MFAPAAVSVANAPAQIVGEFTDTLIELATVTVAVAVAVQPAVVPVTV